MLDTKQFLQEECKNVERALSETLRNEYGAGTARSFFNECSSRLKSISRSVGRADPADKRLLTGYAEQISQLAVLLWRIERAHLGEFFWPFAYSLERIAKKVCSVTGGKKEDKPLFFFSSEGDLFSSYRAHCEKPVKDLTDTRIFNIIFPRSLKHSVLLHTVLGHEIGHAAVSTPKHEALFEAVSSKLVTGTSLKAADSFLKWCNSTLEVGASESPPEEVEKKIASWKEELFCDLFGLLMMGPSFIAAFEALFETIYSESSGWIPEHPPAHTRYLALWWAAEHLNLFSPPTGANAQCKRAIEALRTQVGAIAEQAPQKFRFLKRENVEAAVEILRDGIADVPDLLFLSPSGNVLNALMGQLKLATPPVGPLVKRGPTRTLEPAADALDFRWIIFSGWLYWALVNKSPQPSPDFMDTNRLCAHAILQQEGIRRYMNGDE